MSRPLSVHQILGVPILLAVISTAGLLSALLGDGIWDVPSWPALGAPVVVIAWHATAVFWNSPFH